MIYTISRTFDAKVDRFRPVWTTTLVKTDQNLYTTLCANPEMTPCGVFESVTKYGSRGGG